jgi:hypothetical protein
MGRDRLAEVPSPVTRARLPAPFRERYLYREARDLGRAEATGRARRARSAARYALGRSRPSTRARGLLPGLSPGLGPTALGSRLTPSAQITHTWRAVSARGGPTTECRWKFASRGDPIESGRANRRLRHDARSHALAPGLRVRTPRAPHARVTRALREREPPRARAIDRPRRRVHHPRRDPGLGEKRHHP